ncbi:hypothetical protein M0805_009321 [Coniferiporia weirii]|nr:hypothetical protein M0805_009321 [Coniferiporia weirii]
MSFAHSPSSLQQLHQQPARLPVRPPAFHCEPLSQSQLLDLSPSPSRPRGGTRTRQSSGIATRPSQRLRDSSDTTVPPPVPASMPPVRRIRPLACMSANTNASLGVQSADTRSGGTGADGERDKSGRKGAWSTGSAQEGAIIEFPSKHVVLHPDDANNKVFGAMGRAFLSVNNCAMTVKDLADLSMKYGLVCQNASAAAQAITFFIRSHLQRCETEQDFPLLLRHVLSGTPRDDALAPALYSRSGGNVNNKDRSYKDENGKEVYAERLTCFRRGTTVWYLSKAAGAPCPFARSGIALRDFADVSSITGAESRKGTSNCGRDAEGGRGLKRKRERAGLRRRATSGEASRCEGDEESADEFAEERKPPKIKLTLRLRPCLSSMREKSEPEEEESSSSSDSTSGSDAEDESMDVDATRRPTAQPLRQPPARETTWTFPPYPIQRRISIPPYTPSEETYPTIYSSPSNRLVSSPFTDWSAPSKPKLELTCVDTPSPPGPNTPGLGSYYHRDRAASMPFSIASPPPESDDDFGLGDDDDDDNSFTLSPEVSVKREDDSFAYVWPQAAPSSSSFDLAQVKSESDFDDFDFNVACGSKRSSTQTIRHVKPEEFDFDLGALSLSFDQELSVGSVPLGMGIGVKLEDEGFVSASDDGFSWCRPVDLTQDEPVCDTARAAIRDANGFETDIALQSDWKNVELLGPDSVRLQELEDSRWESVLARKDVFPPSQTATTETSLERTNLSPHSAHFSFSSFRRSFDHDDKQLRPVLTLGSPGSPPSLASSVQTWSAGSPGTELDSVGPASPSSFEESDLSSAMPEDVLTQFDDGDDHNMERSRPWMIPGKELASSAPSRRVPHAEIAEIALSEASAPWERGMISQEDVEEHLLAPAPIVMLALGASSFSKVPLESVAAPAAPEPPLSPQEEAVFQSFCVCPETEWDDQLQIQSERWSRTEVDLGTEVAQEDAKAPQTAIASPETTFANVFAVATRPAPVLRGKRPGRRLSDENSQVRKQGKNCSVEEYENVDDADPDANSDAESRRLLHPKDRNCVAVGGNGKGPLRRSKRVANAAATQRNRERLRKRAAAA